MRYSLFKIREHGIQGREINLMYKKKPVCSDGGLNFQPVRFVDCRILIQLLGIGFAMAAAVFGLELLFHKRFGDSGPCEANVCLY